MWHVAWGTMVCVLPLPLPLIFCSHLPRVDCHLSLLFRPIDGFQNVFWHVRAACVALPFPLLPLCLIPLQPPVCLFLCFRLWHCRQQLDALAWRALKYPGCSVSNVFDESWSRQQAAQSRRCHMWSQYVNASNYLWFHALWHLFIIRWIIFGNSIPLSHQTQDKTSYKSIWKTKEIHQTWLHCQEGTHLSEKVSADIGNMHKLNKISSCQKLFTLSLFCISLIILV